MLELRQYQQDAVNAFFDGVKSGNLSGIIAAPTGSGKSLCIADICKTMITRWPHTRIIVATHKKELIEQDEAEFKRYYPNASTGIYSAGLKQRNTDRRVLFVGIQSVCKRAFEFGKIDLLIIDEAHLVNSEDGTSYARFIRDLKIANPNIVILGMSATPYRLDNGLLYEGDKRLFDCLYYDISLARLIDEGWLCPVVSKGSEFKIDLSGVKTTAGEYNKKSLELAADQEKLTKSAVDEIIKYGSNRKSWLIFASGIKHATHICEEITSRGITCRTITGKTKDEDRTQWLDDFKHQRIRCLVNVEILVAGFNAPNTDLIVFLMATKSTSKYVQAVGRGMRLYPGKDTCGLMDFGQNVVRHGCVDEVTPPKAKTKTDGLGSPPCKECPACFEFVPASARICPACFYEFPEKPKHEAEAFEGAVLSRDEKKERWYTVEEAAADRHIKAGKPDSMRIDYYVLERKQPFSHYITLDHGGYAGCKSAQYVKAAGGTAECVDDALLEFVDWKQPTRIEVKKNGKYQNIVQFDFPDDKATQATL